MHKMKLPVIILAIVGIVGMTFTMAHSGPSKVHAQALAVQSAMQDRQNQETQDDTVSPKPSQAAQQNADVNENDKADNNSTPEVEDGN